MRVVCEACQAKYQIADERVAGRALKIRCRKCGAAISVRGDAAGTAEATDAPGEWFVSTDGNPIGPLTIEQLADQLAEGQVEWDAHVWREGYVDWETASNSDTVVRAVAAVRSSQPPHVSTETRSDDTERTRIGDSLEQTAGTHVDEEPTRVAAVDDAFTSVVDGPTRIAASAPPGYLSPAASRPPFAVAPVSQPPMSVTASQPPGSLAPRAREAFASRTSSVPPLPTSSAPSLPSIVVTPSIAPPPVPAFAASHSQRPMSAPPSFTRAAPSQPPSFSASPASYAPSTASQPPMRAGFAAGEGSGLIDIRALASLAQSRQSLAPSAGLQAAPVGVASQREPLANFGTSTFAQLDSISPVTRQSRGSSAAVPLAILAGFAMVAAAAAAVLYITRAPAPVAATPSAVVAHAAQPVAPPAPVPVAAEQPVAALAAAEPAAAEPADAEPTLDEPAAAAAAEEEPVAAAPKAEPAAPTKTKTASAAGKRSAAPRSTKVAASNEAASAAAAEPAKQEVDSVDDILLDKSASAPAPKPSAADTDPLLAEPTPAKPAAPSGPRDIDDLLDGAVAKTAAPAASALPESPSRDEVLAAMRGIEEQVRACAGSEPLNGTANVQLTVVGSSGRVLNAQVTGIQGTTGSCIARVARAASFKPFARERFTINYPYKFKP